MPLSLRLFTMVMLLTGFCSVVFVGIPAYRQFHAIREIERYGGSIYVTGMAGPDWLVRLIGRERMEAFQTIDRMEFRPTERAIERQLGNLSDRFAISGTTSVAINPPWNGMEIDDTALACIARFPNLKHLSLHFCDISDAGLEHVIRARQIELLDLSGTSVTDAGIMRLAELRQLRHLNVGLTLVSNNAVARLKRALPKLTVEM